MVYAWCVQERALQILKAKLLIVQREQQVEALAEIRGDQVLAEWGQQIRSYVLAPYKMVKDLRTQHETSQVSVATTSIFCCPLATSCLLPTVPCYPATVLPATSQVQDVLDGKIAPFVDAYLRWHATRERREQ